MITEDKCIDKNMQALYWKLQFSKDLLSYNLAS